jgi:hypothetical protein
LDTPVRETPTAVNEGEIAVASNAELHAARISGKQLLALWNALSVSKSGGKLAAGTR